MSEFSDCLDTDDVFFDDDDFRDDGLSARINVQDVFGASEVEGVCV